MCRMHKTSVAAHLQAQSLMQSISKHVICLIHFHIPAQASRQEAYIQHTDNFIIFLVFECGLNASRLTSHPVERHPSAGFPTIPMERLGELYRIPACTEMRAVG